MNCQAPNCTCEAEFETPLPWCEEHWDEWWYCKCAQELMGEYHCEIHKYMRADENH